MHRARHSRRHSPAPKLEFLSSDVWHQLCILRVCLTDVVGVHTIDKDADRARQLAIVYHHSTWLEIPHCLYSEPAECDEDLPDLIHLKTVDAIGFKPRKTEQAQSRQNCPQSTSEPIRYRHMRLNKRLSMTRNLDTVINYKSGVLVDPIMLIQLCERRLLEERKLSMVVRQSRFDHDDR